MDIAPSVTKVDVTSSIRRRRTDACSLSCPIVPGAIFARFVPISLSQLTSGEKSVLFSRSPSRTSPAACRHPRFVSCQVAAGMRCAQAVC
jgi:hypothetical protein